MAVLLLLYCLFNGVLPRKNTVFLFSGITKNGVNRFDTKSQRFIVPICGIIYVL